MANEVTKISDRAMASFIAPKGFVFAKQVTRSVLSQKELDGKTPIYVEFEGAARQAPPIKRSPEEEEDVMSGKVKPMDPPRVADIVNLETGELQIIIMNKVLESELDRAYPEGGYVGLSFGILKVGRGGKRLDRQYNQYRIVELVREDNTLKSAGKGVLDTQETAAAAKSAAKGKAA